MFFKKTLLLMGIAVFIITLIIFNPARSAWEGPREDPPGGGFSHPLTESEEHQQKEGALGILGISQDKKGLMVGANWLHLGESENLIYGNIDENSSEDSNLLLLQKEGANALRVDSRGNLVMHSGSIRASDDNIKFVSTDDTANAQLKFITGKSEFWSDKLCLKGEEAGDECVEAWDFAGAGDSLWQQDGDNIYYNEGNVGIGIDEEGGAIEFYNQLLPQGKTAAIKNESGENIQLLKSSDKFSLSHHSFIGNEYDRDEIYITGFEQWGVAKDREGNNKSVLGGGWGLADLSPFANQPENSGAIRSNVFFFVMDKRFDISDGGNLYDTQFSIASTDDGYYLNEDTLTLSWRHGIILGTSTGLLDTADGRAIRILGPGSTVPRFMADGSTGHVGIGNVAIGAARLNIDMGNTTTAEGLYISRDAAPSHFAYLNIENESGDPIFKVHESGKVGIGTDDPKARLHVQDADRDYTAIRIENTDSDNGIWELRSIQRVPSTPTNSLNNGFGIFELSEGIDKYRFVINKYGKVGIGTNNPQADFHVSTEKSINTLNIENVNSEAQPVPQVQAKIQITRGSDKYDMGLQTNDDQIILAQEDGWGRQAFVVGDSGVGQDIFTAFGFSTSIDAGAIWHPRLIIKQDGKVGIGTNKPSTRLEVVGGSIKATDGLIIPVRDEDPDIVDIQPGQMWLID